MLYCVDWYLVMDVSGQHVGLIFNGESVQEETSVNNFQSTLCNITEELRPRLYGWRGWMTNSIKFIQLNVFEWGRRAIKQKELQTFGVQIGSTVLLNASIIPHYTITEYVWHSAVNVMPSVSWEWRLVIWWLFVNGSQNPAVFTFRELWKYLSSRMGRVAQSV
jgi:hypothetical protein